MPDALMGRNLMAGDCDPKVHVSLITDWYFGMLLIFQKLNNLIIFPRLKSIPTFLVVFFDFSMFLFFYIFEKDKILINE